MDNFGILDSLNNSVEFINLYSKSAIKFDFTKIAFSL